MIKSTRLRTTLSASTILAAGLLLVVAPAQAQNLPDTGNVSSTTSGLSGGAPGSTNPGFSTSGTAGAQTLRVDLKDNRTILNWSGTGFNVAAGNTVDFKDARATSGVTGRTDNIAVLNRDLSGSPSYILGTLTSDPNVAVYVINRSGLLIGDYGSAQNAISTGSFFASNADISDDNSFLNGATTLSFSRAPNQGSVMSLGNVRITTASNGGATGGRMGDVVLIGNSGIIGGPSAATPAVINASGDVLIANATIFTFQNAPGSPLSLSMTQAGTPAVMHGDITARNVTIGSYYAGDGNSVQFAYTGSIAATGAAVNDRGVVLYAQSTDANLPISPFGPKWSVNEFNSTKSITSAKDVSLTGAYFINNGAITAAGDAILGSAGYSFSTQDVTAATITINATSGQFYNLKATVGDILFNGATNFTLQGNVDAARDLLFPSIKMLGIASGGHNSIKAGRNISITASDGIGSLGTFGATIDAGGYISIKQTASTGTVGLGFADLFARGGSVTIGAAGSVDGGSLTAADRIDVTAGGAITLRGLTGPNGIKLTSLGSAAIQGNIQITSAIATGANADVIITTPGVFIANHYNISATPVIDAGRDISVQASGTAPSISSYGAFLANARAGRNIQVSGIGIGATDLVATTGFISLTGTGGWLQVDRNLNAGQYVVGNGARVVVRNTVAGNGTIVLTANAGDLTFSGLTSATGSITLNATGKMNLYATSIDAGGDLIASGKGVDIQSTYDPATGFPALSIKAAGAISINAGTGSVTNNFGRGIIQSNSDGIGTEALTIESGSQLFLNSDLLGGTDRESDVRLRFDSSQGFALRGIRARSLLGASGTDPFTNGLVTTSFVGINGSIDLVNTFSLRAASTSFSDGVSVNVSNGDVRLIATATNSPFVINVPMTASGDIEIRTNSLGIGFDVDGRLAGRNVVLSTPGAFVNDRGADAITATGHWVVYSASPDVDTFVGLDSGNTAYWNASLATRNPTSLTGNRYVFAYQPTLTFTSLDFSKVYGTALNGNNSPYSVTGYQPGVAGAFLGDTAATAFSGFPLFASDGFAERATVAGGPYQVLIAPAFLSSNVGYAFTFNSAGHLTVTPKPLDFNLTAFSKTYDGTTNASGDLSIFGIVAGDTVGTSGTTFAFADKNAGVGKAVNVTGATLTGADAGNYTLSLPAAVMADIFQRAINANVTADNKTYDGTTKGSGTVTLSGVLTGDTVGTSGTTFTFSDKNAGTGGTVTVAGTTLTGADGGNYSVTVPASVFADILKKAITASVTANNKTYDGTTAGTGTVTLNNLISGDSVGTSGTTFTFSDKNAGVGKTVTIGGTTLTGADAGNYTITVPASALADILKKALTAGVTANSKTYDGTTTGTGNVTLNGVVAGDAVGTSGTSFTFVDENAGTGKSVAVAGTSLTGADAGNYSVTVPASALADILKKAITASVTANNKTYDGTTAGTGTVTLNGVVSGDAVSTSGTTFTFGDKNAGTGKTVAVAGTSLTGADAGNYTFTIPASALADILKRALAITADDASKVQNDPDPTLTFTLNSGSLVTGDSFNGGVARDTGENPGTYAIRIGTLSAGNNYTISFTPGTFTINLPLGSEGLQPAFRAQPLPSQLQTDPPAGSSVDLQTSAVCGDDKNCTTGNPSK
jgi:filamentous hemagglutinin family protein